jgi:hypothetical protein
VHTLIQAANENGGKDNVTVIYIEGEQFAAASRRGPSGSDPARTGGADTATDDAAKVQNRGARERGRTLIRAALVVLIAIVIAFAALPLNLRNRLPWRWPGALALASNTRGAIIVTPSESIAEALAAAAPGSSLMVEPGEYRERLVLTNGVRVISRVPREAILRLPSTASEGDPAVVADGVTGTELAGVRIIGDAATPLGVGILATNAELSVVDVEISGAARVAVEAGQGARLSVLASSIHDNPGAALAVRGGALSRISQNVFARNGLSERVGAALIVETDARPTFVGNVFRGIAADAFRALGYSAEAADRDNWFVDAPEPAARPTPGAVHGRRSR